MENLMKIEKLAKCLLPSPSLYSIEYFSMLNKKIYPTLGVQLFAPYYEANM